MKNEKIIALYSRPLDRKSNRSHVGIKNDIMHNCSFCLDMYINEKCIKLNVSDLINPAIYGNIQGLHARKCHYVCCDRVYYGNVGLTDIMSELCKYIILY